jgi:hypothetical protein
MITTNNNDNDQTFFIYNAVLNSNNYTKDAKYMQVALGINYQWDLN